MTLKEIQESDLIWLTPDQVAPVLKCSPQLIRITARDNPKLLGFPVVVVGTRTRIPRKPFLEYIGESE